MNETKIPGIWKWTVILLIACNLGLVLTIWLKPQKQEQQGHNEHRHGGPRNYIIEQLKLSDEQVKKYDALIEVHHSTMERLRMEMAELRKMLFHDIRNTPSAINADSVAGLIAQKQREIELVTYHHFAQVRAEICTDAQKPELDRIIDEVMKQMSGAMRGTPPPGAHEGQGPPPPPGEADGEDHGPDNEHRQPPPGDR